MMNTPIKAKLCAFWLLFLSFFAMQTHAALFDDKEARKKILDVESTMQTQNQATQAAIADLKKNQQGLEAVVKGQGLSDMQNQIETLHQEVARLKGDLELANHQIESLQQRQKDLYTDIDNRLRKLESANANNGAAAVAEKTASVSEENVASTATNTAPPVVTKNTAERQLLENANSLSSEGKHKEAFNEYDRFLREYPNSAFAVDAKYGLGYSQYSLKNYKSAIATQQKVIEMHPESAKVADAYMNMANSQIQLGLVADAKKSYRSLIQKFPNSELTPIAQKRLKALEAIR